VNRYTRLLLWVALIAILAYTAGRLAYGGGQLFGTN
jgi:hypothetical protein